VSAPQPTITTDIPDWAPLQETVSRLRAGQESVERFIQRLLEDVEAMQACLAESELQLADSHHRLAEVRAELMRTQQQPDASGAANADGQDRLTELEDERTALELELEQVRMRAAELAETLTEQQRQMVEERAQWTGELRQMRQLLERQPAAAPQEGAPATVAVGANGRQQQVAAPARPVADPVLGSVMAQFEMLQKDVARRRAATRTGKS
jgi:chromosome segregation ATPase